MATETIEATVGTNSTPTRTMLFYNPGPKILERMAYDHPIRLRSERGEDRGTSLAYQPIEAPEKGFFEVPSSITVFSEELGIDQEVPIGRIYERMMELHREEGIVLVEEVRHPRRALDPNIAKNRKEAQDLGDELHKEYLQNKCNEWYRIVDEVKSAGGVPRRAEGLFRYALKKMHYADPADRVDTIENERASAREAKESAGTMAELRDKINMLEGMIKAKEKSN